MVVVVKKAAERKADSKSPFQLAHKKIFINPTALSLALELISLRISGWPVQRKETDKISNKSHSLVDLKYPNIKALAFHTNNVLLIGQFVRERQSAEKKRIYKQPIHSLE